MEILIENDYKLTQLAINFYQINFGDITLNSKASPSLLVKGVTKLKQKTSCGCTKADLTKLNETEYRVLINYDANRIRPIKQRVTLTTDDGNQIYIDLVGNVK